MRKLLTLSFVLSFLNCVASAQVYEATYLRSGSGRITGASGINDSGLIVGFCYLDFTTYHACYWTSSGVATDLGTMSGKDSGATAVNSLGQIAGYSDASDGQRAFVWTKAGGMKALPSLGSSPDEQRQGAAQTRCGFF
jgi:probable HAF family extracellular repeat protein